MNRPTLAEAAQRVVDALIPQFLVGPNALIGATELNDAKDALVAALRREEQPKPDIEAAKAQVRLMRDLLPMTMEAAREGYDRVLAALEGKR
jgi:hypothetical protein